MKLGRLLGIILLPVGGFMAWIAYGMLNTGGVTLKLLTAGPALAILGFSLLFFPGGDITAKESREKTKDPKIFMKEAPLSHKIAWAVALLIGFYFGSYIY